MVLLFIVFGIPFLLLIPYIYIIEREAKKDKEFMKSLSPQSRRAFLDALAE